MNILPSNHKDFQDSAYWTKFFQSKDIQFGFEWYASYENLESYLKKSIKNINSPVLVVGCGNSLLSEKMY